MGGAPCFRVYFKSSRDLEFDYKVGAFARASKGFINTVFNSKNSFNKVEVDKIDVFTDGSRSLSNSVSDRLGTIDTGSCWNVGCAVFIPALNKQYSFKLNDCTSSFVAEICAIEKAV